MSELKLYDKSSDYGDLRKGFAVSAALSTGTSVIDLRNPASVKYARLLLGSDNAIRDSLDDIASYLKKDVSIHRLTFDCDNLLSAKTRLALEAIAVFAESWRFELEEPLTALDIAYMTAIYGCLNRRSNKAEEVMDEYYYNRVNESIRSLIRQHITEYKTRLEEIEDLD